MKRLPFICSLIPVVLLAQEAKKNPKNDPEQIGNRDVGKGVNFYSIEKEMALGKMFADQVERQSKIVTNDKVSEYVNRVAQNLARNSDSKMPLVVKVIDSDVVNAFTLPGGRLFVNTGLILSVDNEAELAGAIAHEIGHVAARHVTRQATRNEIGSLAGVPLIFLGGWTGIGAREAAGVALPLQMMRFSRGFESEADELGLQYLYKAGYDPNAFVDVFEKIETLEKRKPGTVSELFATHPLTDDRIRLAQKNIQENLVMRPEFVLNTSEFDDVKDLVLTLHNTRVGKPQDDSRPTLKRRLALAD